MSRYARWAFGRFFQISASSGFRISKLSSHGGIGPYSSPTTYGSGMYSTNEFRAKYTVRTAISATTKKTIVATALLPRALRNRMGYLMETPAPMVSTGTYGLPGLDPNGLPGRTG